MTNNNAFINSDTFIPDSELPSSDSNLFTEQMSHMLEFSNMPMKKDNGKSKNNTTNTKNNTKSNITNGKIRKEKIFPDDDITEITNATLATKDDVDEVKIDIKQVLRIISNLSNQLTNLEQHVNTKLNELENKINHKLNNLEIDTTYIDAQIDNQFNKRMDGLLEIVQDKINTLNKRK
jgi:hypothetical protein